MNASFTQTVLVAKVQSRCQRLCFILSCLSSDQGFHSKLADLLSPGFCDTDFLDFITKFQMCKYTWPLMLVDLFTKIGHFFSFIELASILEATQKSVYIMFLDIKS